MTEVALHRARFVDWMPSGIVTMAFSPDRSELCVARENGNLEFWNVSRDDWQLSRTIAAGRTASGVRAVAWIQVVVDDMDSFDSDSDSSSDDSDAESRADSDADTGATASRASDRRMVSAAAAAARRAAPLRRRRDRLITAGFSGRLVEWDPHSLEQRFSVDAIGAAIWSIAVAPDGLTLAAGYEDGTLRLFSLADGGIEYRRALPRPAPSIKHALQAGSKRRSSAASFLSLDGGGDDDNGGGSKAMRPSSFENRNVRALSVAWHADGHDLAVGYSDGTLRRWSVAAATTVFRIVVDTRAAVWTVLVLRDFTIVCGDATGRTQFYDGRHGTLLQSFQQHQADVLALATNAFENKVFASGVDNKVGLFQHLETREGVKKWIYTGSQRCHTHDVRALAAGSGIVVSGGVDSQLGVYSIGEFDTQAPVRILPFPQRDVCTLAPLARLLLARHSNHLHIWQLAPPSPSHCAAQASAAVAPASGAATEGKKSARKAKPSSEAPPESSAASGSPLAVDKKDDDGAAAVPALSVLQAEIQTGSANLVCSAITRDGRAVACADSEATHLFSLTLSPPPASLAASTSRQAKTSSGGHRHRHRRHRSDADADSDAEDGAPAPQPPATPDDVSVSVRRISLDRETVVAAQMMAFTPAGDRLVLVVGGSAATAPACSTPAPPPPRSFLGSPSAPAPLSTGGAASPVTLLTPQQCGGGGGCVQIVCARTGLLQHSLRLPVTTAVITHLSLSPDGQWLVCVDVDNNFHVVSLDTMRYLPAQAPQLDARISGISFHPLRNLLAVVTASNTIRLFDMEARGWTEWSRPADAHAVPRKEKLWGVAWDETRPDLMIVYGHAYMCVVDVSGKGGIAASRGRHAKKAASAPSPGTAVSSSLPGALKVVARYKPLLGVGFLAGSELVVVERPWLQVAMHFPDALDRRRYGVN